MPMLRPFALLLSIAATSACTSAAHRPPAQPTTSTTPPSAPVVVQPSSDHADEDRQPDKSARLVLKVSSSEVASGDTANVHVTNVGDADFVYHFGGASNGCGAFQWKVVLTHEDQTRLSPEDPHRREVCTMQIIRPYDIVIKPGESHALSVDTSTPWWEYRALGTADVSPQLLKAGNYTVQVTGASGKNPLVGFEVLHATVRLGN